MCQRGARLARWGATHAATAVLWGQPMRPRHAAPTQQQRHHPHLLALAHRGSLLRRLLLLLPADRWGSSDDGGSDARPGCGGGGWCVAACELQVLLWIAGSFAGVHATRSARLPLLLPLRREALGVVARGGCQE